MIDYLESYKKEVRSLLVLLKRAFDIEFNFLNKDFNKEDTILNNFEDHKVEFEDLEGNPLKLQHLVNLNESFQNSTDKLSTIQNRSTFNITAIRPWSTNEYQKLYFEKFIFQKEYKSLFTNCICYINGKFIMKGFAKSENDNYLKVLNVERNSKMILKSSNKIKISELLNDPRFKDTHDSVDATYLFPNGEFSVKWKSCFNIFDWPDLLADCFLKIRVDIHSKESSLYPILTEIQQLQIINSAVENEENSWKLITGESMGLTVEQFQIKLENLLKTGNNTENIEDKMNCWNRNVFSRNKDITEILWSLFHRINNKLEFKKCVNTMMPILAANFSSVEFNPNNTTEFCRMLKDRFMQSEVMITSFMTNLELIVQVGLYKLTKDLLFIIFNELPDLSQDESTEIYNKCCRVTQLSTGIESLKQFFSCVSYMEILKDVLNPNEYKIEALAAVRRFLKSLTCGTSFDLEQSIKLKMLGINTKLRCLSSIWIVHYISKEPVHSHKAVIFEVENNETEFHIYRHDMELSDMQMYD